MVHDAQTGGSPWRSSGSASDLTGDTSTKRVRGMVLHSASKQVRYSHPKCRFVFLTLQRIAGAMTPN